MACPTAILISGSGTNLQSFIDQVAAGQLDLDLQIVWLQRIRERGLPIHRQLLAQCR